MSVKITTGDDVALRVTLKKSDATFSIDTGATVKAVLRSGHEQLHNEVTCDSGTAGADWANSLVVVVLPSAITDTLLVKQADLEIEVDDGGKLTWLISGITIEKGTI